MQQYKPATTVDRTASVSYSYWGASKYYQKKATLDQSGRYSFTDYYDNTSGAGNRGETFKVYDPQRGAFRLDTTIPLPTGTAAKDAWKYQLVVDPATYSATFQYDSVGRATDVWKLQSTTTSPWTYVQTHTVYGANNDGSWGQAATVIEDYGSGHINRTTQNQHYTSWGKADQVQDAAGHLFQTTYDLDGVVMGVSLNGNPITTYQYDEVPPVAGAVKVTYGQPFSVTDNLSGVTESISYTTSGAGLGQPAMITESGGINPSYSVSYLYNACGDRSQVTYATHQGTKSWQYDWFENVGDPEKTSRVRIPTRGSSY